MPAEFLPGERLQRSIPFFQDWHGILSTSFFLSRGARLLPIGVFNLSRARRFLDLHHKGGSLPSESSGGGSVTASCVFHFDFGFAIARPVTKR